MPVPFQPGAKVSYAGLRYEVVAQFGERVAIARDGATALSTEVIAVPASQVIPEPSA